MPRFGAAITFDAARSAIANLTRVGTDIRRNAPSGPEVQLSGEEITRAYNELERSLVWLNDGFCVGRAVFGARMIDRSIADLRQTDAVQAARIVTIGGREGKRFPWQRSAPYHVAASVQALDGTRYVLDPLTHSAPQTMDEWSRNWGGITGGRTGPAKLSKMFAKRLKTADFRHQMVDWFGAGIKETWGYTAHKGRAERRYEWHLIDHADELRDKWRARRGNTNTIAPEDQVLGTYATAVMRNAA